MSIQGKLPAPLFYMGRALNAYNVTPPLAAIGEQLSVGQPVVAYLEPGDGTRYTLMIVPIRGVMPIVNLLYHVGLPSSRTPSERSMQTKGALMLIDLTNHRQHPVLRGGLEAVCDELYEFAPSFAWTRRVLAWWLTEFIWPMMFDEYDFTAGFLEVQRQLHEVANLDDMNDVREPRSDET